ncbi:MAG: anti-sigma factor family protein, partial [Limisphaerales bacterium]
MKESSASPESFGEQELTAYLLGELDVPTSQRLEQRLSEDPELRQLLKELSGSMELIREAFGSPVEQGAPLHLNPSRRSSMQDRFKERAGSHVSSGVFSGAFLPWGLPMSLAASLVVGMAWLHFMHGGRIERSASTSTWSFLAKETSEAPIAQTALTRSAPQVPQSRVRPSADAMGSGKLARVEALQETWDVEDTLQSGNAEAPPMALESAHGLSRQPQVSDLSEGLEGFQDEGVDRDRDFGLSTHANGVIAIDETTEQWNLPEPQQPQSDSVMMQRYGLLPSDENGRLSVRSNRPSAPDPSTGSQEALARQVRGRKAGVETQRPLNRGSMAPENADRYFFGASSGESPTVLNESLFTNAAAGPQDEKESVSSDPVSAKKTSQRFLADNQLESNLSQLDFESSVASPNPSMTESSDALGLGFSHSATER